CASRATSANVRNRLGGGKGGSACVLPGAPASRCALAIACGEAATAVTAATASFVGVSCIVAHPARAIADASAMAPGRRNFMAVLLQTNDEPRRPRAMGRAFGSML